jgi:phosphoribosylamine--glycine ligase
VSLFALTDGRDVLLLPPAQDYKRAFDGDGGPNTGGMGSYAPAAVDGMPPAEELADLTVAPVLAELASRGRPFVGTLFVGMMLTADGPRVLEYNCRFGDPETQSLLPLVEGDLLAALAAAAAGELGGVSLPLAEGAAVTVVLAARNYPAQGEHGSPISGIADAEAEGALVFHAGTALEGGRLVTNGGRVLNVTAAGPTLDEARDRAYAAVAQIAWEGMRYRTDIAAPAPSFSPTRPAELDVRSSLSW